MKEGRTFWLGIARYFLHVVVIRKFLYHNHQSKAIPGNSMFPHSPIIFLFVPIFLSKKNKKIHQFIP